MELQIEKAHITPLDESNMVMPRVHITLVDGKEYDLFEYYPDEINFTASEFVGLTVDEAYELKYKKDLAYLRS